MEERVLSSGPRNTLLYPCCEQIPNQIKSCLILKNNSNINNSKINYTFERKIAFGKVFRKKKNLILKHYK